MNFYFSFLIPFNNFLKKNNQKEKKRLSQISNPEISNSLSKSKES
jgi:hypothetical protein